MDPFEIRLSFVKSLPKLNGSTQAIDWSLQYIYQNPDLDEDLYSCILQELDNVR